MADPQTTIADELAAALDGESWSQTVTVASRRYPQEKLEDLTEARITVAPGGRMRQFAGRHDDQCEYTIHILLQRRMSGQAETLDELTALDDEEIEDLVELVDELEQYLAGWAPSGVAAELQSIAVGRQGTDAPPWSVAAFRDARVFKAILTATYLTVRSY